jgi:hypothetical protein
MDEEMNVFLLWFNEWEANYVLGVFETREQAERWKSYFIANPIKDGDGFIAPDMEYFAKKEVGDWTTRFEIEECVVGRLDPDIKVDTLKYVEQVYKDNSNKDNI